MKCLAQAVSRKFFSRIFCCFFKDGRDPIHLFAWCFSTAMPNLNRSTRVWKLKSHLTSEGVLRVSEIQIKSGLWIGCMRFGAYIHAVLILYKSGGEGLWVESGDSPVYGSTDYSDW